MTINTPISGQSVGTSTNKGEGLFPQKITKNAATTAFSVQVRVTNGAGDYAIANVIRVWYLSSAFDMTAAAAVDACRSAARYVDLRPSNLSSGVRLRDSDLEAVLGNYIYLWCDIPAATVAQSLDVTVVELP
jgi:hypothetical protein